MTEQPMTERAQEIRAVLDDVSGAAVASDTRVHLARAALDALDQALIGARSDIAGARAILWQEGDHDGTPLVILAESRMAELAVARERAEKAEKERDEACNERDARRERKIVVEELGAGLAAARKREQRLRETGTALLVWADDPLHAPLDDGWYRDVVAAFRAALVDAPTAATLAEPEPQAGDPGFSRSPIGSGRESGSVYSRATVPSSSPGDGGVCPPETGSGSASAAADERAKIVARALRGLAVPTDRPLAYWRLYREVRQVYTRRGALLWLRHHHRKGTPLAKQFELIESARTGAYV